MREPGLPTELMELVARLLEKKPEDRFQNAAALRQALEAILKAYDTEVGNVTLAQFLVSRRDR